MSSPAQLLQELAPQVRTARATDRVYRDECAFSFDSALAPGGIYTNLRTFQSFGAAFVALDVARNSTPQLYLHQKHHRVKKVAATDSEQPAVPTKLAIGGDGGFAVNADDKFDVIKTHELVAFAPTTPAHELVRVALESPDVPPSIRDAVDALLQHAGNTVVDQVASWQEELKETKYADALVQLPDAPRIPSNPAAWTCQAPQCDKRENLWLNLSDGFIGCGRANWDGSGGCGAALEHYKATGSQFPLAVKLGTISADGGGDVYSYAPDEDDMVTNRHLTTHLAHFGIRVAHLRKTDKSMHELQVGLNLSYDFDAITEAGHALEAVTGAGRIGLKNLGNSCYMNSVLQLLFALREVQTRYKDAAGTIFSTAGDQPADDVTVQMAKLATALLTDTYAVDSTAGDNPDDVELQRIDLRPLTFRSIVGKGHADFSTGQQQDAVEYLLHLLDVLTRSERVAAHRIGALIADDSDADTASLPTASLFRFAFEDRVECLASHKVKYVPRDDAVLQLQIPIDAATNATQVQEYQVLEQKRQKLDATTATNTVSSGAESTTMTGEATDKVVPVVPFDACVAKTLAPEVIEDFLSTATGRKGLAQKTVRFQSFPRYLLVQMQRFYVAEDWTPAKLDVVVNVPEELSLGQFLSTGLRDGEELLPDDATAGTSAPVTGASSVVTPDDALVAQLVAMGFSENGCKRAAIATGNADAETAMEWIFSHMEDADFNDPPVLADATADSADAAATSFNVEHVSMLGAMGFSDAQATCALSQTNHDPDRAAEWLFSHMDDLDAAVAAATATSSAAPLSTTSSTTTPAATKRLDNNVGDYALVGFVSHIGRNTSSGHYVAHVKKHGRWLIFNDDKVALSADPPLGAGYLYLFRRKDVDA